MKFAFLAVASLLVADHTMAFVPVRSMVHRSRPLRMALDMPPAPEAPPSTEVVTTSKELPAVQPGPYGQPAVVRYSDLVKLVKADRIEKVTFNEGGTQALAIDVDGNRITCETLPNDPTLMQDLNEREIDVTVVSSQQNKGGIADLLQSLLFPAILFGGLFFLSRRAREGGGFPGLGGFGGPNNPFGVGKSKIQIQMIADTGVSFQDVAGCDGAKLELEEVVDFLSQPEAYTKNGCKVPKGVILEGPPGTGKTLLAKAVAGEAGVPFISSSGSEFVEMFVGVGASRVRDVFSQAKKNAPCIIFIDEIDAVARQRGAGYAGGNDEREQTVNQFLVEMDGFAANSGIIVIAATNRMDVLDNALLRPGRFDRKVTVGLPDWKGREKILAVHARGRPLEPDVDLEAISRRTPGFSGAQLESLMNEAAITAARAAKESIGWEEIDSAVDRVLVGDEAKGNTLQESLKLIAYHEAGHAVMGALVPDYDQVQKISIVPRSNGAGGLTFFSPLEARLDSGIYTRQYLESQLAVALGGRLAEEIIFESDQVTTGASNDFQQVTNIARAMVYNYGMSPKIGRIALGSPPGEQPFAGMGMLRRRPQWSQKIMTVARSEVERLVNNAYVVCKRTLNENRPLLDALAEKLLEQEVVSAEEFQMLLLEYRSEVIDYEVYSENINNDKLPFQPASTQTA